MFPVDCYLIRLQVKGRLILKYENPGLPAWWMRDMIRGVRSLITLLYKGRCPSMNC